MYRISQLAGQFGLSRSTLLHYDRIGLLKAAGSTPAGYRIYSEPDRRRLKDICRYRQAGLALDEIRSILESPDQPDARVLKGRLAALGRQIQDLQAKQRVLAGMLKSVTAGDLPPHVDKSAWVQMLQAAGMDDAAMDTWHAEFEKRAPRAHHAFLLSLGILEEEALNIRNTARLKRLSMTGSDRGDLL